jgi:hypothetical protein
MYPVHTTPLGPRFRGDDDLVVPRRMILIFLADEPQRLMRSAQHMPLLEPHRK